MGDLQVPENVKKQTHESNSNASDIETVVLPSFSANGNLSDGF